jgi:hypothetical protein
MASTPRGPRRFTLVEPTRSSLTGADIAAPYRRMAGDLDAIGETLDDIATPLAEEAGLKSVRKDEQGNLVVDRGPLPMIGKPGKAFKRAAEMTYAARAEGEIATEATKMRLESRDDPDAFRKAGDSYIERLATNAESTGGVRIGAAVRQMASREIDQNHRSLLVEKDRTNATNAVEAYKSRLSDLDNRMGALARQGGTDTDDYRAAQADAQALYGELERDPRFKYPKERVDREISGMASRHKGEAVIGTAMRIYDKGSPQAAAEARRYLQDAAGDPALNLSTAERQQIVTRGMAALEGRTGANKALVDANKKLVGETIEGLKTSAPYDERRINDMLDRSVELGDVESYSKLQAYKNFQPWRTSFTAMPIREQAATVQALTGGGGLVDRIVGNERGATPDARNPNSSATGDGQFIDSTWLDQVKRNRPDLAAGKSDADILALRKDPKLSREMVGRLADENATVLRGAGAPVNDGSLYLAHFLGAGDAIKVLKAPPGTPVRGLVSQASIEANPRVFANIQTTDQMQGWSARKMGTTDRAGGTVSGVWGEAVRTELGNDLRKQMASNLEGMVTAAEKALGQGRTLGAAEMEDLALGLQMTGRGDLRRRLEEATTAYDTAKGLSNLPTSQREALRGRLAAVAAEGADPVQRRIIDTAVETARKTQESMSTRPYSTAAQRFGTTSPFPMVFEDPQAMAGAVQQRDGIQGVIRNVDGTGPISIFEGEEAEAFRGALSRANPQQVVGMVGALGRLDDETLTATLQDKTVKEAVTSLTRTTDPAKFSASMSALDGLYTRLKPEGFTKLFGTEATHALMTWQSNLRYMDEKTLAAERAQVHDPQVAEVRQKNAQRAETEARKVPVEDIVKAFDTSWGVTPGFIARNVTGSQPLPPPDGIMRDVLQGDFVTQYARRYVETNGNEEKAKEQAIEIMKTKWKRSEVNGGRLMVRAPEGVYPAVDGSHKWMAPQIEAELTSRFGPRQTAAGPGLGSSGTKWDYALIADAETERDATGGKPPSYQVLITRPDTKKVDVVRGDDGKPLRYRFDPSGAQAAVRERFDLIREGREDYD